MKNLILLTVFISAVAGSLAALFKFNPDFGERLTQRLESLFHQGNGLPESLPGSFPSPATLPRAVSGDQGRIAVLGAKIIGWARSPGEQFPGVPFPSEHSITDAYGRVASMRVVGLSSDTIHVVRMDTGFSFAIPLADLSPEDQQKFARMPQFSVSEVAFLMNKKREVKDLLARINTLQSRLQATTSQTATNGIVQDIERIYQRIHAAELSVEPLMSRL